MIRSVRVSQVLVNNKHSDRISDVTFNAAGIKSSLISHSEESIRESILSIWEGCKYLLSINLGYCQGITDVGLSALGHGCSQLQTINLSDCQGITDVGLSALRAIGILPNLLR